MNIEIEKPLDLLLELIYINGTLNGRNMPETKEINSLMSKIKTAQEMKA